MRQPWIAPGSDGGDAASAGHATWLPDPCGNGPRFSPRRIAVRIACLPIRPVPRAGPWRSGRRRYHPRARAGRVPRSSRLPSACCANRPFLRPISPSPIAAARVASRYSDGRRAKKRPQAQVGQRTAAGFRCRSNSRSRQCRISLGSGILDRADAFALAAERGGVRQMSRLFHPDQAGREHRAHRSRIDPAIGVPADRAIDRAMVHAGGAADTAQHFLKVGPEHGRPAVIDQHDMVFLRPIQVARPPWTGGERGVDREILAGCRPGQNPQQRCRVLQRRARISRCWPARYGHAAMFASGRHCPHW